MPVIEGWLGFKLTTSWGMTETVIHATRNDFHQHYPDGTMGRPTPGYEFLIVDNETGQICAPARSASSGCAAPAASSCSSSTSTTTRRTPSPSPTTAGSRPATTSTMSADGYLFFRDRDKDALKVGGENVSAREVEDVCRQVPGIADIAVVGQKHEFLDQVAVAFVVAGAGRARRPAPADHRPLRRAARRLQGAPRRLPRRRVPHRHPRQGRQEQAPGDGRRDARRSLTRILR